VKYIVIINSKKIAAYVIVITLMVSALFSTSWYYSTSPANVIVIMSRGFSLNIISSLVKVYDPTEKPVICTGPSPSTSPVTTIFSNSVYLQALIQQAFPNSKVSVSTYNNKSLLVSRFQFGYQPFNDSNIIKLRVDHGIDQVIADKNNDFEQLLAIANWVNKQWEHGSSGTFDPTYFNANEVLSQAKQGATFWCHVSAMTFIQVAATMGFQGRLVSLSRSGYVPEHAVAEVWSNYYNKWIMIDPDFNVWYIRGGTPLNVLEIHNTLISGANDGVIIVKGKNRPISELESRVPNLLKYYAYFEIDMRNDWLTNHYFPGHPSRSDKATLFWKDVRLPPVLNFKTDVSKPDELYWDLNRSHLTFNRELLSREDITVYLQTITPNFSHFEVTIDGVSTLTVKSNKFIWKLHVGANSVEVKSVNAFGQKGIPSNIDINISRSDNKLNLSRWSYLSGIPVTQSSMGVVWVN
jgi:hypothetical protein